MGLALRSCLSVFVGTAAAAAPCPPSRELYNGICLPPPGVFPPRNRNLTTLQRQGFPPPLYLQQPPAVINIDVGRQLWVDSFLAESSHGVETSYKQARMSSEAVLTPQGKEQDARMGSIWW